MSSGGTSRPTGSTRRRVGTLAALLLGAAGTLVAVGAPAGASQARGPAPAGRSGAARPGSGVATPPFRVKVIGRLPDGRAKLSAGSPTGLSPAAIQSVYNLSGLSAGSGAGSGQIIAIVDAYQDAELWTRLAMGGQRTVRDRLSPATVRADLAQTLKSAGLSVIEPS